jgi:hypothetical protein
MAGHRVLVDAHRLLRVVPFESRVVFWSADSKFATFRLDKIRLKAIVLAI